MLDINIAVNGRLIGHVHTLNVTDMNVPPYSDLGLDTYDYEYYEPERGVRTGTVEHCRASGVRQLLEKILNNMHFGDELTAARERAETPAKRKYKRKYKRKSKRK